MHTNCQFGLKNLKILPFSKTIRGMGFRLTFLSNLSPSVSSSGEFETLFNLKPTKPPQE